MPTIYEIVPKDLRTRVSFVGILFGGSVGRTIELFAALGCGDGSGSVSTPFLVKQWLSYILDSDPHQVITFYTFYTMTPCTQSPMYVFYICVYIHETWKQRFPETIFTFTMYDIF